MLTGPNTIVIDNLLAEDIKSSLIECVKWMPLHFLNRWNQFKSHELDMHWYYPIAFSEKMFEEDVEPTLHSLDESLQPISRCWDEIKRRLGFQVRLYECMLSANTFGTEGRIHQDIGEVDARMEHLVALVYVNETWNVTWGGETIVFDEHSEISAAVMPKPGRVVIITGDPIHVGRSVSRICPTDRRVLVYKMWRICSPA